VHLGEHVERGRDEEERVAREHEREGAVAPRERGGVPELERDDSAGDRGLISSSRKGQHVGAVVDPGHLSRPAVEETPAAAADVEGALVGNRVPRATTAR